MHRKYHGLITNIPKVLRFYNGLFLNRMKFSSIQCFDEIDKPKVVHPPCWDIRGNEHLIQHILILINRFWSNFHASSRSLGH